MATLWSNFCTIYTDLFDAVLTNEPVDIQLDGSAFLYVLIKSLRRRNTETGKVKAILFFQVFEVFSVFFIYLFFFGFLDFFLYSV